MMRTMLSKISGYSVYLQAWYRRDGRAWIAWAPALNVMTQDHTKKRALENLREAVEGWFESCVERGVLDVALQEAGFAKAGPGEVLDSPNTVEVAYAPTTKNRTEKIHFEIGGHKGADYIVGKLPGYIAASQLGESSRAAA